MSKEKKEKKEEKVVTIRDFKVLIEGMDMVLGDDWVPTDDQWKRIRAKIDAMIKTEDRAADRPVPLMPGAGNVDSRRIVADDRLPGNFPEVPSTVPAGAVALPPPSALTPPVTPTNAPPEETVKTPDIDSSQGYSSQFV